MILHLKDALLLNKLVENKKNGVNLGRIAAFMGAANMTVVDCWATDDMKILNSGVPKTEFSGELVGVKQPHDGETKSKEFLSNMQNYLDAGWGKLMVLQGKCERISYSVMAI